MEFNRGLRYIDEGRMFQGVETAKFHGDRTRIPPSADPFLASGLQRFELVIQR